MGRQLCGDGQQSQLSWTDGAGRLPGGQGRVENCSQELGSLWLVAPVSTLTSGEDSRGEAGRLSHRPLAPVPNANAKIEAPRGCSERPGSWHTQMKSSRLVNCWHVAAARLQPRRGASGFQPPERPASGSPGCGEGARALAHHPSLEAAVAGTKERSLQPLNEEVSRNLPPSGAAAGGVCGGPRASLGPEDRDRPHGCPAPISYQSLSTIPCIK